MALWLSLCVRMDVGSCYHGRLLFGLLAESLVFGSRVGGAANLASMRTVD